MKSARVVHTMLRVADLDRAVSFYTAKLGMTLLRREDYPAGRFTLAFVGYGAEADGACLELTHNWDRDTYDHGDAYGHMALAVDDVGATCLALERSGVHIARPAGPMSAASPDRARPEVIAFIEDPDGYRIELVENRG
ncbi:lactoylglutathione lyase [Betaproteobacteria bacterium GR16-43]|nr:lactoylglutathione lyase [Betaproteobacteria bacterium GR16-43]